MIRKSVVLTIMFATMLVVSAVCRAQTNGAETDEPSLDSAIQVARAGLQADRTTIVTAAMKFSDKDAAVFWPIYRQYEYERSKLDDRRVAVIKEYAAKYENLSDADAKAMAERMFDCESRLATLKKTYYKKLNKVLSAYTVTKFFQLDHRIDLLTDMKVEASLPPLSQPTQAEQQK